MTTDPPLRIASTITSTRAEGPGHRFAVWVQGCTIRCDGCFNPHMWSPSGGATVTPAELAQQVTATDVEGVTLLGGEPFEQAPALARFAKHLRVRGLSVMVFTGYYREDLELSGQPGVADLLAQTDLLVDGPYVAEQPDLNRPWIGSTNQRFHFLTDRYRHLEPQLTSMPDRIEVRIKPTGEVSLNGWATVEQLDDLLADTTPLIGRGRVR